jgi:hypothetical protein
VPDAICALRQERANSAAARTCLFIEIDRGSMTIAPAERVQRSEAFLYRATVLRKFAAYAESWREERHYAHLGIKTPRVLFLAQSPVRGEAMSAATLRYVVEPSTLPPGMFLFGSFRRRPADNVIPRRGRFAGAALSAGQNHIREGTLYCYRRVIAPTEARSNACVAARNQAGQCRRALAPTWWAQALRTLRLPPQTIQTG